MSAEQPSTDRGTIWVLRNLPSTKFVVLFEPPLRHHELKILHPFADKFLEDLVLESEDGGIAALAWNCETFGDNDLEQGAAVLDFFRSKEAELNKNVKGDAISNLGAASLADWEVGRSSRDHLE